MTRGDKRCGVLAILDSFRGETAKGMAGAIPTLLGLTLLLEVGGRTHAVEKVRDYHTAYWTSTTVATFVYALTVRGW